MKISKDSPVIKRKVSVDEWKFAEKNATKVAICVSSHRDRDGWLYHDIIAELEYEEYLEIKGKLKAIFDEKEYWTMGGWELGLLIPMQEHANSMKHAESSMLFYVDTKIVMSNSCVISHRTNA